MDQQKPSWQDLYLRNPIFWDFALSFLLVTPSFFIHIIPIIITDKNNQISAISNLIASCISLAGFSLAALTIIVTVRANVRTKSPEEAHNGLDLILSSKHYSSVVKVFKGAIIEFVLISLGLFCFWGIADGFSASFLNRLFVGGLITTALTVTRSLYILFSILDLEQLSKK